MVNLYGHRERSIIIIIKNIFSRQRIIYVRKRYVYLYILRIKEFISKVFNTIPKKSCYQRDV